MTETVIIHCLVLRETDQAFLLRDRDQPSLEAWFPKSEIYFHRRNLKTLEASADIPLWLLREKGWNQ